MAMFHCAHAILAAIIYFAIGTYGDTPLIVGNSHPIRVSNNGPSDIPPVSTLIGTMFTITHPGATYIALHFSDMSLVPDSSLEISNASGEQSYILRGRGKMDAGAFWAQHIKGDTVLLHLMSQGQQAGNFTIDEYATGFVELTESTCGTQDLKNAICYATSHATEYATSKAVARLLIGGTSLSGGEGSILGTVIGAFIISTLTNGLRILSVPQEWQMVVTGGIVVLAVYLDILRRRRK